jgi:intein/homing endonuclease
MQHKFLVRDEDGTETWKMAMELKEGDDVVQIKE